MPLDISTITGKPQPTTDERFELVKAVMKYLKGNLMGPEDKRVYPESIKEFIKEQQFSERSVVVDQPIHWMLGEVDGFHGGGVFSKFSDDFMKSGTGGHVFGWGHYVSEEKGVAKYYKDLYAKEKGVDQFKSLSANENKVIPDWAAHQIKAGTPENETHFLIEEFKRRVVDNKAQIAKHGPDTNAENQIYGQTKIINTLKKLRGSKDFSTSPTSAQYKVKLFKGKDPSEYNFLDWDKKPKKEIANKIVKQAKKEGLWETGKGNLNYKQSTARGYIEQLLFDTDNYTGGKTNANVYAHLRDLLGSQKEASLFLNRAGIDGIRYPTGTLSGLKDTGKKNYVIFDPKNIEIMEGPGKHHLLNPGYPKK